MPGVRPPERERWHILSITAHRRLSVEDTRIIHTVMSKVVIRSHIDAIYFGGARGGDTEALKAALYFRGKSKTPWLAVVCPDTLLKQPLETHAWSRQADEIIELKNAITKDDGLATYGIRDQYLVDVATQLLAFFNDDYKTGTGKTVKMAEADGLKVTKIKIAG